MPVELRKLIFSEPEIQKALVSFSLRKNIKLPTSAVAGIEITEDPERMVVLHYAGGETGGQQQVTFQRAQVGGALIRFCRDFNIPMPRDALKVVRSDEGGVTLMLRREMGRTGG